MPNNVIRSPNFSILGKHDELLLQYAAQAERYVFDDPDSALIKLRQLAKALAKRTAAAIGLALRPDSDFLGILNQLRDAGVLTPEV